ncbi:MAG: alpha/beta fold hydrolase [Ktedonobacterales bacterium]
MGIVRVIRRGATLVGIGAAGSALVVTARHLLETPQPLISVLPGEARIDRKHGGDIYYNVAGPQDAEPLVLLHDFYPGASNYEFREIFQSLAGERRVYAPDWLGFGMSEHPHVAYTGEFYASVLTGFVRDVVARPATVLAHGRAANIAVRAASDTPGLFDRLILVSPYAHLGTGREPTLAQTVVRGLQRVSLGIVPYAVVSTRPVLRWEANTRSAHIGEGASSSESIDHSFASAHQFGGQHAMLALLTGALDLPMRNAFALLEPPALIVGGALDRIHPRSELEDLALLNPHADLEIIPDAGEAPYGEQPDAFVAAVTRWLSAPQTRHILDESALVPPIEHEPAGVSALPSSAATEQAAEPMTGTPGYVVPGVSDMGLDALSTVTYGGVANVDPSATPEAPDAHAIQVAAEIDSSPEALLPEAGDAEPSDAAERRAREEEYPPFEPGDNIADVTTTQTAVTTPNAVETSEQVETPSDAVETPEQVVTADTQDTAESGEPVAPRPPNPTQPRRSTSRSQPSQSTSSAPREPGARMEGRSSKTSKSGGKSTASKATGEGSSSGKRHSSRKSHK